jgi:hypothetical protein
MQAIITRYVSATKTLSARIIATAGKSKVCVVYDSALERETNHVIACRALMEKMEWYFKFVSGQLNNDYVHVLTSPVITLESAIYALRFEFPRPTWKANKIAMIQRLRTLTELGLKEAKDQVETLFATE